MGSEPSRVAGTGGEAGRTRGQPLRLAALDIGTHATKLLVAEIATTPRGIGFRPLARLGRVTRLGAEAGAGKPISPDAAARAVDAARALLAHAQELGVGRVIAAGTGILRRAPNGRAVAGELARSLRIELPVLEPQVEAALSFLGLRAGLRLDPPMVAVDLGGGTTELTELGPRGLYAHSLDLGCLDLTERFLGGESSGAHALHRLDGAIRAAVPRPLVIEPRSSWAAVGGTISALAAIDLGLAVHDPDRTHRHRLTRRALARIVEGGPLLPGQDGSHGALERDQAHVLHAGAAILLHLLRIHRVTTILTSSWGLRQGLLLSAMLAPDARAGRDPRRSGSGAFALAAGPRPEVSELSSEREPRGPESGS